MSKHEQRSETVDTGSPSFWTGQWKAVLEGTPFLVNRGYSTPRYWDNAAKTYDDGFSVDEEIKLADTVDELVDTGFLFEGAQVLDIGCGTGRLAVAFAGEGAEVTAIDFSESMIERLRSKLSSGLEYLVNPICMDWGSVDLVDRDWERNFDLVVAHMTPAVRRPEAFLKMIEASCGGCVFKGWAGRRKNFLLEGLWNVVMGEPLKDRPPDILFAFNLLYSLGYYPGITVEEVSWARDFTPGDALTHYLEYFTGVSDQPEAELADTIRSYLETLSVDGVIREKNLGRTGLMKWLVNERRS